MNLSSPCPAAAYVTCPWLWQVWAGRVPVCRAGPHVPRHRRHEESYAVGHGPFFWLFANVCV